METNYDGLFEDSKDYQKEGPQMLDKEAWAAKQKAQREALYTQADGMADKVLGDPEYLRAYLEAQARLGRATITNTLLLMAQRPGASRVHTFEEWQRMGRSIKSGEQASLIFQKGREYVREDGTIGAFQNVRRVFDIRQTTGKAVKQPPIHPVKHRLKALMAETAVPCKLSDNVSQSIGASFNSETCVAEVARGLDEDALFFCVARELARAEHGGSTFECDCAANILCNRYGMAPRYPDARPEEYVNLDSEGKREALFKVRKAACAVMERMDRNLARLAQAYEKRQDGPQR